MQGKLLFGVSGLLAGALVGYYSAQRGAPATSDGPPVSAAQRATGNQGAKPLLRTSSSSQAAAPADLETRIREITRLSMRTRYQKMRDLARSIPPGQEIAALDTARTILDRNQFMQFNSMLCGDWAERDARAVLAYGLTLKKRDNRVQTIANGIREFARVDPEGALSWLTENTTGQERESLLSSALSGMAADHPQLALDKLQSISPMQRRYVRQEIIHALADTDPQRAAEMAIERSTSRYYGGGYDSALGPVMTKWIEKDPEAAIAWFSAQPESVRKKSSVMSSLQQLANADGASAMRLMEKVPPGPQREQTLMNVLNTWGRNEPGQLKAWMDTRTDPKEKQSALLAYAQGVAQEDPKSAAELLRGVKADRRQAYNFGQVFRQYAEKDPQAALAMAMETGEANSRKEAVSGALAGWAMTDPQAAADHALSLPSGPIKNEAMGRLAQEWAQKDPTAAMEFLKKVPNPAVQKTAIENMLWSLSEESPHAAAEMIKILPSGLNQTDMTAQLAERWADADIDGAIDWVKALPEGTARSRALQNLGWRWASHDPAAATDFLKELPSGQARDQMVSQLSSSWAWRDPQGALEAAQKIPEGSRQKFLEGVVGSWAGQDPEAASKYITEIPEGSSRDKIVKQVASQWSNSDASAALEWVQALPQGEGRAGALAGVLGNWAAQSPQEAATYVTSLQGEELERGMKSVISSMAGADPTYAASWVKQFPEGAVREQAEEALMKRWAREDPTAAATWLNELPQGGNRDVAIKNFAETAAAHEPQLAWQWAMTIRDPEQKREVLERAAASWVRQNDGEARAAIQASGLPADVQTKLLRRRD